MSNVSFQQGTNDARDARILVTIPLTFKPQRLIYVAEMLRTLADFPVARLDMFVLTNATDKDELKVLEDLVMPYRTGNKDFHIRSEAGFVDKYDLCWRHHDLIADVFIDSSSNYTHFLYSEDDIRVGFLNFCYFLRFRPLLSGHGLLPSFARVEFNRMHMGYFATDYGHKISATDRPDLRFGDTLFAQPVNPHCACYILDREMAHEYIASPSFKKEESRTRTHWNDPERAAMGLCFENVPSGYGSRYVVPLNVNNHLVDASAWVYHLPNNYTDAPNEFWGKQRMDALFDILPSSV